MARKAKYGLDNFIDRQVSRFYPDKVLELKILEE